MKETLPILADIHQQIFFAKFHEHLTLPGEVDSIFESVPQYRQMCREFNSIYTVDVKI